MLAVGPSSSVGFLWRVPIWPPLDPSLQETPPQGPGIRSFIVRPLGPDPPPGSGPAPVLGASRRCPLFTAALARRHALCTVEREFCLPSALSSLRSLGVWLVAVALERGGGPGARFSPPSTARHPGTQRGIGRCLSRNRAEWPQRYVKATSHLPGWRKTLLGHFRPLKS